jgi:hypothetical protein
MVPWRGASQLLEFSDVAVILFTRSASRIPVPNGRPFATSLSPPNRVRYLDFWTRAVLARAQPRMFARALLHRPQLLFLDEPTAGLDSVTARRIRQVIRDARQGSATVFLTTHDMVTANELCDRVAFLVDGQIAAHFLPHYASRREPVNAGTWGGLHSFYTFLRGTSARTRGIRRYGFRRFRELDSVASTRRHPELDHHSRCSTVIHRGAVRDAVDTRTRRGSLSGPPISTVSVTSLVAAACPQG